MRRPPESLRDVDAALHLAEKAVRLDSGNARCLNTLGAVYYRAGRFREAVEVLRTAWSAACFWCISLTATACAWVARSMFHVVPIMPPNKASSTRQADMTGPWFRQLPSSLFHARF
jgi:tetratricopeptide repeat protein